LLHSVTADVMITTDETLPEDVRGSSQSSEDDEDDAAVRDQLGMPTAGRDSWGPRGKFGGERCRCLFASTLTRQAEVERKDGIVVIAPTAVPPITPAFDGSPMHRR
jgi:hypothetical protein